MYRIHTIAHNGGLSQRAVTRGAGINQAAEEGRKRGVGESWESWKAQSSES